MHIIRRLPATLAASIAVASGAIASAGTAAAQVPQPWQIGMQAAHSPVQQSIEQLHNLVLIIITVITLFVAGLLAYVMVRYSARRNPTPSRISAQHGAGSGLDGHSRADPGGDRHPELPAGVFRGPHAGRPT